MFHCTVCVVDKIHTFTTSFTLLNAANLLRSLWKVICRFPGHLVGCCCMWFLISSSMMKISFATPPSSQFRLHKSPGQALRSTASGNHLLRPDSELTTKELQHILPFHHPHSAGPAPPAFSSDVVLRASSSKGRSSEDVCVLLASVCPTGLIEKSSG